MIRKQCFKFSNVEIDLQLKIHMSDKVVLGYWGIRGLGQVSRLLLAYTGAVWEDKQYTDREEWTNKDKEGLGLSFPNLPYLLEGDFKLTESSAIARHIINRSDKKDLLGKDAKDHARVDMVLGVLGDIRSPISPLFFNPEWEKLKDAAFEKIKGKLDHLAAFIGNKDFTLGYVTLADFVISETSFYVERLYPEEYKKYEFFGRIRKHIESLPAIKHYYEQPTAMKGPFFPPTASIKI